MKRPILACAVATVAGLTIGVVCHALLLLGLYGEPSLHCAYKPPWVYAFFPSLLLPTFAMVFASWDRFAGRVFTVISTLLFFGPLLFFPDVSACTPDTAFRYVVEKLALIAIMALSLAASWYGMAFVLRGREQAPGAPASGVRFKVRSGILVSAFAALFVVLAVGVVVQREKVRNDAEALAGGRPYCIQIPAKDAEYRPVRQWSDLAIFALRGSGPLHHAVLVVGPHETAEVFHWSYWSQRFIAGTAGPQPIYCDPRADFLKSSATSTDDRTHIDYYMAGRHFSIPRAYRPVPRWAGQFGLLFYAAAPRFQPLSEAPSRNDRVNNLVEVAFQSPYGLETHLRVAGIQYVVESSADEHGLNKQMVRYAGSTQQGVQYFLRSPHGRVITLIECSDRDDVQCLHSFEHDGWTYRFHHVPSEVPNWRAMQQRLTDLTRSFSRPG